MSISKSSKHTVTIFKKKKKEMSGQPSGQILRATCFHKEILLAHSYTYSLAYYP